MSAFLCSNEHLSYLVWAATHRAILGEHEHTRWSAPNSGRRDLYPSDYKRMAEVGEMLRAENLRSLAARYGDNHNMGGGSFALVHFGKLPPITPAQVIKACDCYDYQACETEDYERSEAHSFITNLRKYATWAVPGYDEAQWEVRAIVA